MCEVVAYYAYANRIADGLGILSEVGERSGANSWVEKETLERETEKKSS